MIREMKRRGSSFHASGISHLPLVDEVPSLSLCLLGVFRLITASDKGELNELFRRKCYGKIDDYDDWVEGGWA